MLETLSLTLSSLVTAALGGLLGLNLKYAWHLSGVLALTPNLLSTHTFVLHSRKGKRKREGRNEVEVSVAEPRRRRRMSDDEPKERDVLAPTLVGAPSHIS